MSVKHMRIGAAVILVIMCLLTLVFVYKPSSANPAKPSVASTVTALPGYDVDVFAKGNTTYYNPDSVDVFGKYVYIGYQNTTAKDGSDHKTSTIVQYTKQGKVVHTFSMPGHNDGLRFNPTTHLLWATSNEDGNPVIVTIDPEKGTVTNYQFPAAPHGGGYDDVIFLNGKAFIAASNPTLDSNGVNLFPAVDQIELKNGKVILTPVLNGNATATDLITKTPVTLNLTDPDSQTLDNQGNLVQADQAGMQLIFLHKPGTAEQTVTHLSVGTQIDDTVWTPAQEGRLLVVDGKANTVYAVTIKSSVMTKDAVYTEAPSDSGVAGFVGKLDLKTGNITPVIIGLVSPTGLTFMPTDDNSEQSGQHTGDN